MDVLIHLRRTLSPTEHGPEAVMAEYDGDEDGYRQLWSAVPGAHAAPR